MTEAGRHRRWLLALLMMAASSVAGDAARAQTKESGDLSFELVDPKVLRVCADPRNLPFSSEKGEGFENKLAELFAEKLQLLAALVQGGFAVASFSEDARNLEEVYFAQVRS